MAKRTQGGGSGLVAQLECAPYRAMCQEFAEFRIDPVIRMMEKHKERGRILGFVRGLRLSAQLIYAIRDALSGSGLHADWGHLLDKNRNLCSPECDVIIYDGAFIARWNKHDKPVMDFYFVECSHAVAVISCKSYLANIDKEYIQTIKPFMEQVWLFAECCPRGKEAALRKKARAAGYRNLFYLYPWDGEISVEPDRSEWTRFLKALETLKHARRGASK